MFLLDLIVLMGKIRRNNKDSEEFTRFIRYGDYCNDNYLSQNAMMLKLKNNLL